MKTLILKLYLIWSLVVFTITMLVLMPLMLLPYVFGIRVGSHISYFFMRWWAFSFSLPQGGIWYRVKGRENLRPGETYIFCANHNSFLDTPAFVWAVPHTTKPLGKVEMTKVPIFGFIYRYLVIMVDRKSPESRRASMVAMRQRLSEGISVLVFPEGQMNKGQDLLQPFFDGAFRMAVDSQRPVVPVVIRNSKKLLPPTGGLKLTPGIIDLEILPPIPTAELHTKQVSELKDKVWNLIHDKLAASN